MQDTALCNEREVQEGVCLFVRLCARGPSCKRNQTKPFPAQAQAACMPSFFSRSASRFSAGFGVVSSFSP